MKEVAMPEAFLDFADALRMLSQCSLDATELVTKWNQITDTTTPAQVTITVNGTTRTVDNLAKIRQDLVEGLSLDSPKVKDITFESFQANGGINAVMNYGSQYKQAGGIPYLDDPGYLGVHRGVYNDFYTVCLSDKASVSASFLELPKVLLLGVARNTEDVPPSVLNLTISAPTNTPVQQKQLVNTMYYTTVTFVNRNTGALLPDGTGEHMEGLPFTLNVYNTTGTLVYSRVLDAFASVTLLLYTAPGLSVINIQELH